MNIILGQDLADNLAERYTVLRLDTFTVPGKSDPVPSYCVIETLSMAEMMEIEQWKELHEKLLDNYAKRNWNFCQQAIGHLLGRWNGDLDSFYRDLESRVSILQNQDLGPDWSPIINRQNKDIV